MDERTRGRALAVALVLVIIGGAALWTVWVSCAFRGCPDVGRLEGYAPEEASLVVDRDGDELAELYRIRRVVVPIDELPSYVPAAFVAIEDERFWRHGGVDWQRMLGAMWVNARALEIRQGFSTITMQLARNLFPEQLPAQQRTISRKLAEMRVARRIEDRYRKEEILAMYMNQIYFGSGAWGIEAAAQEYFGKPASEVTLAEGALLAGLPRAPARLNPRASPHAAVARRDLVLRTMAAQGRIPRERADRAIDTPLRLARAERPEEGRDAPYFVEAVRRRLEEQFGPALYTGGYRIYTTLDADVQRVARRELARQLDAIEAGRYGRFAHAAYPDARGEPGGMTQYLQGAVVVLDAASGDVLGLVGGRDFRDSEYNRATQAERQPGSAFKPFVYATALGAGRPLTHTLQDTPLSVTLDGGRVWTPRNYGGGYAGPVSMRDALVQSRNVATVRLARDVGLDAIVETARRLDVADSIPVVPSLALGSLQVTPLDLTAAYAAFANGGRRPEPRLVTRVEDADGRVVWSNRPRSRRALNPDVAFLVTDVLRDVVDRGTATAVRGTGYGGVAAGKTGTTNDATNVWFVGYTPARVAGVWIGFDRPQPIIAGATGGELAAPVWGRIMRRIGAGADGGWEAPAGVERYPVARGEAFDPRCPGTERLPHEYFLRGTVHPYGCAPADRSRDSLLGVPADTLDPGAWHHRLRRGLQRRADPDGRGRRRDRDRDSGLLGEPGRRDTTGGDTTRGRLPGRDDRDGDDDRARRRGRGDPPDLLGRPVQPSDTTSRSRPDPGRRRPRPQPPDTSGGP